MHTTSMPSPHAEVDVHPNHPSEHRVVVYDGRDGGKWLVIERDGVTRKIIFR